MEREKEKESMKKEHSISPVPLPEDLTIEIMKRLPLTSMIEMSVLSKNTWEMLGSKEFVAAFVSQSSRTPQLLFSSEEEIGTKTYRWFHSIFLEEEPSTTTPICLPSLVSESYSSICQPILGLVCCYDSGNVVICNPGAGTFIALPKVNLSEAEDVHCFFGFDPKSESFKVLCITTGLVPARNPQVFTLGDEKQSWREIEYDFLHYPMTDGLFLEGRIYYGACSEDKYFIMSFDLEHEDFTIIPLPEGLVVNHLGPRQLLKIDNKLAIVKKSYPSYMIPGFNVWHAPPFDFWILNDLETRTWSRRCIEIPSWEKVVGNPYDHDPHYYCIGTIGTGELVFASFWIDRGDIRLLYYDPSRKKLKKVWIDAEESNLNTYVDAFLDHVETPLLSIRTPPSVRATTPSRKCQLEIEPMVEYFCPC